MKIVFLGPPGAGKGTQANIISDRLGVVHISTGEMFRHAVKAQTPMGLEAKRYMDSGALVPDEVTVGIVKERIGMPDCAGGYILDGFPRNVSQADALDSILMETGKALDAVVLIEVGTEIMIQRLTGRRTCRNCEALYHVSFQPPKQPEICDKCGGPLMQREDDREETVRNRLVVYHQQTLPLINYYQKKGFLIDVDGSKDREKVTEAILASFG